MKYFTTLFIFISLVQFSAVNSSVFAQNNQGNSLQTVSDGGVQQAWVARYNGPANNNDYGQAIAVDDSGNVYVTGRSFGTTTGQDYATIKYNTEGVQQWVVRYNGPNNGADLANAIAVDHIGNVYVTGQSSGIGTFADYGTVKYNSSGVQQWAVHYNDPGNGYDFASSIAVDDSGYVYVTGDAGGNYATVKYSPSGVQQWAAVYNGPANGDDWAYDVIVDDSGYVYVTGYSAGILNAFPFENDYATIKYNSSGVQQWVARYNDSENGTDNAYTLALDDSGNVYVTGTSILTWQNSEYSTVKYNSSGVQQWEAHYDGPVPGTGSDNGYAIALDDSGNVYVTGDSHGVTSDQDMATVKYNSSGQQVWVARYNGPGNGYDEAIHIAVDAYDYIYVMGSVTGLGTMGDYAVVKYNSSGAQQWVATYNGPADSVDCAFAMAIDNSDNIYVTGWSQGIGTGYDYATVKFTQTPVPVELTSFDANVKDNKIFLSWSTATETNNQGFDIERSQKSEAGSQSWDKIGFVQGNGTTTKQETYSFVDKNISSGTYYYRLKQIDLNGTYSYSKVIEVNVNVPAQFSLSQNYPNPFNPGTTIKFSIPKEANVSLSIYNVLGQKVAQLVNSKLEKGNYTYHWDASKFASGIYLYELRTSSFISIKKMLLLK